MAERAPIVVERPAHAAFTLIELVIVMAIIAVLAALLLPAIKSVQVSARTAVCQSNLRQLVMGMHAYIHDWRAIPGSGIWYLRGNPQAAAAQYFEMSKGSGGWGNSQYDILKCPADKRPLGSVMGNTCAEGPTHMQCTWAGLLTESEYTVVWMSYTASELFKISSPRYGNLSKVSSMNALFWDGFEIQIDQGEVFPCYSGHNRHRTGLNAAFKDGRVTWHDFSPLKAHEMWSYVFYDPASDWVDVHGVRTVGSQYPTPWFRPPRNALWY